MITNEAYTIGHSAKAPPGPAETCAEPPITTTAPRIKESAAPYDLDSALVEAAEKLDFDWPEFLPVERVMTGITEIALGFALVAGIAVFWCFLGADFVKR